MFFVVLLSFVGSFSWFVSLFFVVRWFFADCVLRLVCVARGGLDVMGSGASGGREWRGC